MGRVAESEFVAAKVLPWDADDAILAMLGTLDPNLPRVDVKSTGVHKLRSEAPGSLKLQVLGSRFFVEHCV